VDWSNRIGRRIRLRDLHILQTVAQQGSMAKAARHLAISQPVISKVVADLERQLGHPLLDRDRHGAEPTIYGAALLKHGLAVFDELKQGVEEIEYLADPTRGELRIGTHDVIAAGFLPAVIKSLHRRHPKLTIHAKLSVVADTLYRELRDRNVDLILGRNLTAVEDDLEAEILFNETTVIVAGKRNQWARRRKIGLADLIHERWVFPAPGSVAERIMAELFRSNSLEMPRQGTVCAPMPVVPGLVANGPYLANLPGSLVHFGGNHLQLRILPIKVPVSPSPVAIVTLKHRTINPIAKLFIEHAREVAKPFMSKKNLYEEEASCMR